MNFEYPTEKLLRVVRRPTGGGGWWYDYQYEEPAMHGPAKVRQIDRFVRKAGRGQRKWNVWSILFKCDACQREFIRLQNTSRGRKFCCVGTDKLKVAQS